MKKKCPYCNGKGYVIYTQYVQGPVYKYEWRTFIIFPVLVRIKTDKFQTLKVTTPMTCEMCQGKKEI
jgi:DnaJ-class molecular chaperone